MSLFCRCHEWRVSGGGVAQMREGMVQRIGGGDDGDSGEWRSGNHGAGSGTGRGATGRDVAGRGMLCRQQALAVADPASAAVGSFADTGDGRRRRWRSLRRIL